MCSPPVTAAGGLLDGPRTAVTSPLCSSGMPLLCVRWVGQSRTMEPVTIGTYCCGRSDLQRRTKGGVVPRDPRTPSRREDRSQRTWLPDHAENKLTSIRFTWSRFSPGRFSAYPVAVSIATLLDGIARQAPRPSINRAPAQGAQRMEGCSRYHRRRPVLVDRRSCPASLSCAGWPAVGS